MEITMVPWLRELDYVNGVCDEAARDIRQTDPGKWWKSSRRGDWMLYYIYTMRVNVVGPADVRERTGMVDVEHAVQCPMGAMLVPLWASSFSVDLVEAAELANRVRVFWPELPLA